MKIIRLILTYAFIVGGMVCIGAMMYGAWDLNKELVAKAEPDLRAQARQETYTQMLDDHCKKHPRSKSCGD